MTTHLLAVGVNGSRADPNIRPLDYAEADAREFHRFCAEEMGFGENAVLLADAPSFLTHVRSAVEVIGWRIVAGDTFVFYFAGHGYVVNGEPYGLLSHAELAPLEAGRTDSNDLLSISWLRERVRDAWPRGVHFACILDACRTEIKVGTRGGAGMAAWRKQLEGYAARGDFLMRRERPSDESEIGDIELYACPLGEQSHEFAPIGRGMFSYALQRWLRQGVEQGEPRVLDEGLATVLERSVDDLARDHRAVSPGQRPVIQRRGAPVLLFDPRARAGTRRLTRSQEEAVAQFEAELAAKQLDEPYGRSARDTLSRLHVLRAPPELLAELTERLQEARKRAREQADAAHDARLVADAEELDNEGAWIAVAMQGRLQPTRDLARRRLEQARRPPPPPPDPAEVAFTLLGENPSAAQCQAFLRQFVASPRADAVHEMLARIRDDEDWAHACRVRTEASLARYLAQYPSGVHEREARASLAEIKTARQREAEARQRDAEGARARAAEQARLQREASEREATARAAAKRELEARQRAKQAAEAAAAAEARRQREINEREAAARSAAQREAAEREAKEREREARRRAERDAVAAAVAAAATIADEAAQREAAIRRASVEAEQKSWLALRSLNPTNGADMKAAVAQALDFNTRFPLSTHYVEAYRLGAKWASQIDKIESNRDKLELTPPAATPRRERIDVRPRKAYRIAGGLAIAAAVGATIATIKNGIFKHGNSLQIATCVPCGQMSVIEAGSFEMGSPDSEPERLPPEGPVRTVRVGRFEIGRTEVTQGQWRAVMGSNPSRFKDCGDACPVEQVSWDDITGPDGFLSRLNRLTGMNYRLPSEAEWEYAARAGRKSEFWWGRTITSSQANYAGDSAFTGGGQIGEYRQKTLRADAFEPNEYGLRNVHGNVAEWVQDCWHDIYWHAPDTAAAWEQGCTGMRRVVRGGSWVDPPGNLRSAYRSYGAPDNRYNYIGFRLARTP